MDPPIDLENFEKLEPEKTSQEQKRFQNFLMANIVGQERAVKKICGEYSLFRSSLKPSRGVGGLIIGLGPTGVGKTELGHVLADFLFKNRDALTYIDCGTMQQEHEVTAKLLGSPAGYLGHKETPALLKQSDLEKPAIDFLYTHDSDIKNLQKEITRLLLVQAEANKKNDGKTAKSIGKAIETCSRRIQMLITRKSVNNVSIIVFDELEKASYTLSRLLLNILYTGSVRLADNTTTYFHNSIIVMTSNLGSRQMEKLLKGGGAIGFAPRPKKEQSAFEVVMQEAKKHLDPEFIGRIRDKIVVFGHLNQNHFRQILGLRIADLQRECIVDQNYSDEKSFKPNGFYLKVDDEKVRQFILEESIDHPEYGARMLKQKIEKYLRLPLARMLETQQIRPFDTVMVVMESDGSLGFYKNKNLIVAPPIDILDPNSPLSV